MANEIDWSKFVPDAPAAGTAPATDWSKFIPEAAPEAPGLLRKGADLALDFTQGAYGAIGAGASAFGADNLVAKGATAISDYAVELQSQQRQAERLAQAQRMQDAEATGSMWEEAKAAGQNVLDTPLSFFSSALGSLVPTVAASVVGGAPAALTLGAGMGAGAVKQSVAERVEQEALKAGQTPEQAAAAATAAQAYRGDNLDQIALGAGLGALAGGTGVERLLGGGASAIKNILGRAAAGAVTEAVPEAMQGGQERLAANVAAQREGFGGDTWTGVVGQGVTEGLASTGPGGIAGAMAPYIDPNAGPISRAAIKAQEQQAAGALPAPGQLSGEAAMQMGDSAPGQDPTGALNLQQRNTNLQDARAEQESQRAEVDLDYLDQVNGWEPGTAFEGAQQRLAQLEQAARGTPDQEVEGPDGQPAVVPGIAARAFSAEEQQEYDVLRQAVDANPRTRQQAAAVGASANVAPSGATADAAPTEQGLPFTQPPYAGPAPTVGEQGSRWADPRIAIAGEPIPDPAAQLEIDRPSTQDQFLAAQRKRAQGELLSQQEAALLNGPDPFEGQTVSLASPADPAAVAAREEAVQDVAFANGDEPANVRVFSSQDLPDGPSGNQRGAGLTRPAAAVIEGLGRLFGTQYRFYDSPNAATRGDGFVLRGRRPGVAYVRATEGDAAPLVVAGHETYHTFTPAERARFSAAIEPFVDVSDVAQLAFLSDYTGGRYQAKVVQLVQAGVAPTEVIDAVIDQAQQDGTANLTRAALREEFDADIFGNRMKDTGFWEKVFTELKAQDRTLLVKIRDSIKQVVSYLKSQAGKVRGFDTDRYIQDLDAVQRIAARTLLSAANTQQKGERGSRSAAAVVRSEVRDRLGPYPSESFANMNKDWYAKKEGVQYAVEQAADGYYLTRTGATNEGQGQTDRGRAAGAVPDAERRGSGNAAPDVRQRAAGGSEPAARQSRAPLAVESRVRTDEGGRVSLTGIHFSRQPRRALSGSYYGTGLKGAEGRRLAGASDRRLLSRVYAYVNEGKGVKPEAGVGSYPHTVELSNLYDFVADPLKLIRKHQGDLNAVESAILDEGFDGYYVRDAFGNQGAAVVLGDASIGLRAQQVEAETEVVRTARRAGEDADQVLPTRWPTAVGAKPSVSDPMLADLDTLRQTPKQLEQAVNALVEEPGMRTRARSVEGKLQSALDKMVANLLWLHDLVPADIRARSKLWYEGAGRIAARWAKQYGKTRSQAAGILAVLSPQKDWFMNVTMGERVLDILSTQMDHRFDNKMKGAAFQFLLKDRQKPVDKRTNSAAFEAVQNKTLREVIESGDLLATGVWLRAYDEAHHAAQHAVIHPEGDFGENATTVSGSETLRAWGGFDALGKAASIFIDGSAENINAKLGGEHKVRNFYNNIYAPKDARFATIDTHAVAADLLRPLAGADKPVADNFGNSGGSNLTGVSGTYPIHYEACKRAAEARGILPREMQSITWEAVRGLFTERFKGKKENLTTIDNIWRAVDQGKLTVDEARAQILEKAGGIEHPDWWGGKNPDPADARAKSYQPTRPAFAGTKVVFEVAPDPNDRELTRRWGDLPDAEKRTISYDLAWDTAGQVLAFYNSDTIKGELHTQVGGYLEETNPSFSLWMNKYASQVKIQELARVLGYVLKQDSMVVASPKNFKGATEMGAVVVHNVDDGDAKRVYDELRAAIRAEDGSQLINGHTTAEGGMAILVDLNDLDAIAQRVADYLGDKHDVSGDVQFVQWPERGEDEYGLLGSSPDLAVAPGSPLRTYADRLRAETEARLEQRIQEAEAGSGKTGTAAGEVTRSTRRNELGFYSQLSRAVDASKFQTQPAGQWKLWLASNAAKAGVKADEVQWSGINEWLELQGKRKVEKAEVLQYLKQGGVQVQEVQKTAVGAAGKGRALVDLGWPVGQVAEMSDRELEDAPLVSPEDLQEFLEWYEAYEEGMTLREGISRALDYGFEAPAAQPDTRYADWRTPGGENYREVLLTMPVTRPLTQARRARIVELQDRAFREGGRDLTDAETKEISDLRAAETMEGATARDRVFKSNHWDEKNVLAHIRLDDRIDADGKRVLFVQEIQSDWGQEGRKKGFGGSLRAPLAPDEVSVFLSRAREAVKAQFRRNVEASGSSVSEQELDRIVGTLGHSGLAERAGMLEEYNELMERSADDQARAGHFNFRDRLKVQAAPFVTDTKSWVGLALKRVVSMATEEGYDRVAIVSGQQAADIFDLSQQVDSIQVHRRPDGFRIIAERDGRTDDAGVFEAERLPDVVGKELADKITQQTAPVETYTGDGLKVGGEGMKAFYDRLVPQVARDVLKKLGGQLQQVPVVAPYRSAGDRNTAVNAFRDQLWAKYGDGFMLKVSPEEEAQLRAVERGRLQTQLGFDITPAMRETVTGDGLPLFSAARTRFEPETHRDFQRDLARAVGKLNGKSETSYKEGYHQPILVMRTPPVLRSVYERAKANSRPFRQSDSVVGTGATIYLKSQNKFKGSNHGRPVDGPAVQRLPYLIADPLAVFQSTETGEDPNSFKVLGADSRGFFVAAIKPGYTMDGASKKTNFSATIFPVQLGQVTDWVKKGALRYWDDRLQKAEAQGMTGAIPGFLGPLSRSEGAGWLPGGPKSIGEIFSLAKAPVKIITRSELEGTPETMLSARRAQTETPEFKRWFGGSKVVDGNGQPLVVYHGGAKGITAFDKGKIGASFGYDKDGFFFTTERGQRPGTADNYAGDDGEVYPVYLSLQNPYTLAQFAADLDLEVADLVIQEGSPQSPITVFDVDREEITRRVREGGYDGVAFQIDYGDGTNEGMFVALEPEQIKSATGNAGTFDPADPDITRSARRAQTETAEFKRWFGDSKVVDAAGQPRVVYHGTRADISAFDPGAVGSNFGLDEVGFFFTSSPIKAASYADPESAFAQAGMRTTRGPEEGANIVPAYLSLQNPLTLDDYTDYFDSTPAYEIDEQGISITDYFDDNRRNIISVAQEGGHDGVLFQHRGDLLGVVFSPAQIKSATGNSGAFNPADPDITRSAPRANFGDMTQAQEDALRAVGLLREPKTVRERFAELTDNLAKRLTQGVVDQYAPLKELDFRSYVLARMSKGTDGTFEAMLYYGRPQIAGDTVEIDTAPGGLMEVLSTLSGEQDRFLAWIAANRAEQLTAEGREFLFTPEQIRELKGLNQGQMADGRGRAVEYARVLREFNAFQDSVLAIAEARGLIDAQSRQVWQNGFYVPFYRNMEDGTTGPSVKSGLVNQYAFKKLKGSSRQLNEDLLANTLQNMAHLLSAAAKNQAASASLRAAESAGVAHRVPSGTKGAVRFLDAGREQHYLVDDPFIYDAITSLESVKVVGLEKVLSKFKHWLTLGVTINPAFQLRSLMRDAIQSIAITNIDTNPLANVKQGIASQLNKDQDYINALASGGLIRFNSLLEGNRADHTRKLIKMGVADSTILDTREKVEMFFTKALDKWLAVGDISESTNRMALYKQQIAAGVDPLLAAYQARDLMDFSMQGQWRAVRFLTQVVPFLNARLQGLYKLGRDGVVPTGRVLFGGGDATDKQIAKRFGAVTGAVAMASIALMAAYADDEDWKKREDWDRDAYWWFKIGDTAFRIPKPFEVGAIGTIAERTAELFMTDDLSGDRFLQRLGHMMSSTFALNPIPQMVKPLLDVYANEESFTQRPIETMGMERLQPQDRFTGSTSELAKWLGQLGLPEPGRLMSGQYQALSPVQIDALIRGYFSWLGVSATRVVDLGVRAVADRPARPEMQLRDVFFAGNFVEGLPANSSRYVTALYDQSKAIESAYASYRFALRQGDQARATELLAEDGDKIRLNPLVTRAKQTMSKLNENIRAIERNMMMSPAEKRAQIDRIKAMQNQIAMRISAQIQ